MSVRVLKRLRPWLLRETYALPVDVFRILVGVLCSVYFLRLLFEVEDFSSPMASSIIHSWRRCSGLLALAYFSPVVEPGFLCCLCFGCLGAWGIILGYRIKLCAAVLFVIAVSHYRWNFIVLSVDDSIMHLLLFWLLLSLLGRHWYCKSFSNRDSLPGTVEHDSVPGTAVRCFLGNVCLAYLVAGLWKLESPMWRQGFALYTVLRLPIAYQPDLWGPQHLPWLQIGTYVTLALEPLLPILLTRRPGHPLKWCGLLAQLGFHLGIVATLRVPFANLGLMASAVLSSGPS